MTLQVSLSKKEAYKGTKIISIFESMSISEHVHVFLCVVGIAFV